MFSVVMLKDSFHDSASFLPVCRIRRLNQRNGSCQRSTIPVEEEREHFRIEDGTVQSTKGLDSHHGAEKSEPPEEVAEGTSEAVQI
jgi:hypothetical protein